MGTVSKVACVANEGWHKGGLGELLRAVGKLALFGIAAVAILNPVLADLRFVETGALLFAVMVTLSFCWANGRKIDDGNEGLALAGGNERLVIGLKSGAGRVEGSRVEGSGNEFIGLGLERVHLYFFCK